MRRGWLVSGHAVSEVNAALFLLSIALVRCMPLCENKFLASYIHSVLWRSRLKWSRAFTPTIYLHGNAEVEEGTGDAQCQFDAVQEQCYPKSRGCMHLFVELEVC